MVFGLIIIGDELLSGKRQDQHFMHAVQILTTRGLELKWCQIIGDDPQIITDTLKYTLARQDIVFCFGGIGATPDDHTRQCAASAAGVRLARHPEAVAEIEARFGTEAYPHRILMADLPEGSNIIPNPYNRIPGFSLAMHYFLPGFPTMAWPMMEWVLDSHYAYLNQPPQKELSITVFGVYESHLLELMQKFVNHYPELRFSSLPSINEMEPRIELSVRGDNLQVTDAMNFLKQGIGALGVKWNENVP